MAPDSYPLPAAAPEPLPVSTILDAATCAAPQHLYTSLRTSSPILRAGSTVVVSRRREMDEVLRNPERFASDMESVALGNVRPLIPLQVDPPDHARYRRLLDPLFAPKQVAKLEAQVRDLAMTLIDGFASQEGCDLVPALTVPLPSEVFLALLGLPLAELPLFLAMKDGIVRPAGATAGEFQVNRETTAATIYAYFEEVLAERRVAPRDDLVSRFVATEVDGRQLTHDEILDICFLLLVAGLDTVSATLECMFAYLAQHPAQRRILVDEPDMMPRAVEELLRWETPVMGLARMATEETSLGGVPVHPGDRVVVLLGAPNLEPGWLEQPERVDLRRAKNRHVTFGTGVHRCLGAHLARLELRVTLAEFHRRIPDYHLEPGATLRYNFGIRSIEALPLRFGPGPG